MANLDYKVALLATMLVGLLVRYAGVLPGGEADAGRSGTWRRLSEESPHRQWHWVIHPGRGPPGPISGRCGADTGPTASDSGGQGADSGFGQRYEAIRSSLKKVFRIRRKPAYGSDESQVTEVRAPREAERGGEGHDELGL